MAKVGRPRRHPDARTKWKMNKRSQRARLAPVPPAVVCRTLGPCTLFCSRWESLYELLPRSAAIVTDPPYDAGYDVTKARRRPSQWTHNFVGADQRFDPTPWLRFPEVLLMGASHYKDRLPQRGSWHYWDKLAGGTPADFAPGE